MRLGLIIAAFLGAAPSRATAASERAADPERTVCGPLLERLAFATWSAAAGRPNADAWRTVPGAGPISHRTADGRTLRGFRIAAAAAPDDGSRGFVLFIQGNAMLADQLLDTLAPFAAQGLDAYVYDYRGYGLSEGRRRLAAMVADYREIFPSLSAAHEGQPAYLYGVSFGGLLALNVVGGGARFDRAVIDSTPSRISRYGCPENFDPVSNLPDAAATLLIVSGRRDTVVTAEAQAELRDAARSRGARVVLDERFAHPFMDRDATVRAERWSLVEGFLLGREAPAEQAGGQR